MIPGKDIWYDWYGLNEHIFKSVNGIHEDTYDMIMIVISQLADHKMLPYYLAAMLVWFAVGFIAKKIRSDPGAGQYFASWICAFLVLGASFAVDKVVVEGIKKEASYPRPYVAIGSQDVIVLEYKNTMKDDSYHSFPSGHVSMITVLVIGLWSVLSIPMRIAGVIMIPLVCWSRMAMGMHFPADVLAGFLISLLITVGMRFIISRIFRKFGVRC